MPKSRKAYHGSWDPFEDIVAKLDKMKAPYILLASQEGMGFSVVWSNLEDYGNDGVESAREALNLHLDDCL